MVIAIQKSITSFHLCGLMRPRLLKVTYVHPPLIQDLLQAVEDIGNWRGLCTNFRVDEGIMNKLIYSSAHSDTIKQDCLTAYWNHGEDTWTEVIKAVYMAPINNQRVAKRIAKKYGVDFDKAIRKDEL